jgi:gas vesicle protein
MGRFINGVFVGIGIGLLVAPMRGEEMRRLVRERIQELRGSMPEQLNQYPSPTAFKTPATPSNLSDVTQQSAQRLKQTGEQATRTTSRTTQGTTTAPSPSAHPEYVNPERELNP